MAEEKGNIGLRALWDGHERDVFTVPTKVEVVTMLIICNDTVFTKIILCRW